MKAAVVIFNYRFLLYFPVIGEPFKYNHLQFDLSIVYILTYGMFFILFANQQYIIRFSDEVAFQSVDDSKFVLRKNDNIIFAIV